MKENNFHQIDNKGYVEKEINVDEIDDEEEIEEENEEDEIIDSDELIQKEINKNKNENDKNEISKNNFQNNENLNNKNNRIKTIESLTKDDDDNLTLEDLGVVEVDDNIFDNFDEANIPVLKRNRERCKGYSPL